MPEKFSIFDHKSTQKVLRSFIESRPQRGRGVVKRLAEALATTSSQISQYASGRIVPSIDHAFQIASTLGWSRRETEYFVTLIEMERAGHHQAKDFFREKLEALRLESLSIGKDLKDRKELTDLQKSRFYSSWIYSALRMLCSLPLGASIDQVRELFPQVSLKELDDILEFLLANGLVEKVNSIYKVGTQHTWVPKNSEFIKQHHCNWRLRAIERSHYVEDDEFMLTSPMSLSSSAFKAFRRELQEFTKNFFDRLPESGDPEEVVCLNVDLFRVFPRRKPTG